MSPAASAMPAASARARVSPTTPRERPGAFGRGGDGGASTSSRATNPSSVSPSPRRPGVRRRRARVVRAAAASGGDKGGWLRPLEGLAQRMGVTIYQAPAPPAVVPGARVDFLESMLQWHLDTSTSADLVMREVQDAIVAEVTSFPVDKVAVGESPSVAMHVPIPLLRQSPDGPPSSLAAMGARSARRRKESDSTNDSSSYGTDSDGPLFAFPEWDGWTQPTTAMTLRAVLMTASALSAAAGMRGTTSSSSKTRDDEESFSRDDSVQILLPLNPAVFEEDLTRLAGEKRDIFADPRETETARVLSQAREATRRKNQVDAESLRLFFEKLWPDSPYSFGTYDRENVTSDVSYLLNEQRESFEGAGSNVSAGSENARRKSAKKKRERRLVVIVNVSAPGNETAAESDGEGMVNAAETLLELGVPFVVLTLWMDDSLARGVASGRPAKQEREALRVRMEKRTRILLGRSVKRKEARENVRRAFEAAKKQPQGAGYVALEEALAEARAVGADAGANGAFGVKGGEAEAMLAEIRAEARAAEASALAAALTAACLQVPVDVAGLEANLQRARGVLARAARDGAAADAAERAALSVDDATTARAARDWNESAAEADRILSLGADEVLNSAETLEEEDEDDETSDDFSAGVTREDVMSADVDRFASGANTSNNTSNTTSSASLTSLGAAVDAAEAALEAVSLEGDLRAALADETSLEVSAVPRLEGLMLRAAKVAERKPPLTQEGAAKLNALTSRCFSRATALQEMEEARAALAKALEPSLRGEDLLFVRVPPGADEEERFDHKTAVPALERAVARARGSAWPWQLADAAANAETVLERWRAIGRVRDAFETRDAEKIRREIAYAKKAHPEIETRIIGAERALAELEAEDALEGGDRRLKAYFAASKMAWSSGAPNAESAEMLRTIRDSLAITDAEHEQVTKAVSAGSRTASENARAKALEANVPSKTELASVSFSASVTGTRGPMFEGSDSEVASSDSNAARDARDATELYVLNWDDDEIELYVGGAGPRTGEFANVGLSSDRGSKNTSQNGLDVADEATRAWLSAVPDDENFNDAENGASGEYGGSGGWRRVGADIIYNEEEIVGVGSSGTYVFRGYVQHTTRARHAVAVKRIARPPGEEGRELLRLVEREVELLTTLNQSPRVPFFHRWAATSSHVFIALELCAESLREHVVRLGDSMPVERRFEILRDVASGIAWLHDPNKPGGRIAHNDLKPENLLVDSEGDVKIADVGLGVRVNSSKLKSSKRPVLDDVDDEATDNNSEYTMSTFRKYGIDIVLAGRAPEMLAHRPLTPAADVWAMGVVFFFALTGRASPFSESGRDVPTDAAIINGRHHLQCVMNVPGLVTRRALEARHLLASMLAPDPNDRPTARDVLLHPLFWSDEKFLASAVTLHFNSASFDKDLGSVLSDVADDALLNGAAGGGNAERGALLAAASMDLTDWKRLVDGKILKRVTKAHAPPFGGAVANVGGPTVSSNTSNTDVGRKPYGDGFSDLIRFCRNVSEHPPTIDEVEPMIRTLAAASADSEARAAASAAAASAKKSARRARVAAREGGNAGSENMNPRDDSESDEKEKKNDDETFTKTKTFPGTALFPPGVDPNAPPKRLTREQRRLIFSAYVAHLFPGMPLAVFEVAAAMDAAKSRAKTAREARANGNKRQKQRGRSNAKARGR